VILLVGGTGILGREVLRRLAAAGQAVRILTRDPAHGEGLAAQVAIGDLREPATLVAAATGCSTVVAAAHGFVGGRGAGPQAIDDRGNGHLVDAAVQAGASHLVLLSVFGARPDHPMSLHRAKHAAEEHLRASTLGWTVLRPTSYIETWAEVIGTKLADGGPALVFGRGSNPINFVSVRDVAVVVKAAITDPALRGQAVDVPGPDNITMTEFAERLGAAEIKHVPRAALRILATTGGLVAPARARQAAAAIVMDTIDMTADASSFQRRFPAVQGRRVEQVICELYARPSDGGGHR
jgi:uncharacterized protein YbjT (DUF2867 family)